jgi:hypothetical protein
MVVDAFLVAVGGVVCGVEVEVRRPPSKVASRASGVRVSKRVLGVAQSAMGEPPRYGWVFEQRNLS